MEKSDIESGVVIGGKELYPKMTESPELRWAFIRKVYAVLTLQMIVTVGSFVVYFFREISVFITTTTPGLVVLAVSLLLPLLTTLHGIVPQVLIPDSAAEADTKAVGSAWKRSRSAIPK